jgi:hypothetical protein
MEFQCRVIVQRRFASYCKSVENIPLQAERHSARRQETVRLPIGIGVHLQTGMLFGITTESCSASERNRVHFRPDSPFRVEFHPYNNAARLQRILLILEPAGVLANHGLAE